MSAATSDVGRYRDPWGRMHRYGPPEGWVCPESSVEHFDAAADWAQLIERGLKFDEYTGPASLSRVRGDCLEPLVTSQHMLRTRPVAPDESLIDGALYIIDCSELATQEAEEYREKVGVAFGEPLMIAKVARWIGFQWHLLCKDSYTNLENVVVGMVVGVLPLGGCDASITEVHARQHLCGNPFDAGSSECSAINQNAATAIFISGFNTPTTFSTLSGPNDVPATSSPFPLTTVGPNADCTAIVTLSIGALQNLGTSGDLFLEVAYADDGSTFSYSTTHVQLTSTYGSYTLQWQFAHTANNSAPVATVAIHNTSSGAIGMSSGYYSIQVEFVKR
jgi:hypothetical protein